MVMQREEFVTLLNEFVEEMESKGYWKVSNYFRNFRKHKKNVLLFAY